MKPVLRWALGFALADLLVFVLLLAALDLLSTPAFGPPQTLGDWAAAYERLHWPLQAAVGKVQASRGCQGIFLQSWRTPQAQIIRLLLFCLNSACLGALAAFLALGLPEPGQGGHHLLGPRLREWLKGRRAWNANDRVSDPARRRALDADLDRLHELMLDLSPDWQALLAVRRRALGWVHFAGGEARLWQGLGLSTLALAKKAGLAPEEEASAFGLACLRQALVLAPEDPSVLAANLAWSALDEGQSAEAVRALERLAPSHIELLQWPLRRQLARGTAPDSPPDEVRARLVNTPEGKLLLAEVLLRRGEAAGALELVAQAVRYSAQDRRSRRLAEECARQLDEAAQLRVQRLPPVARPPLAEPGWILRFDRGFSWRPLLAKAGPAAAGLLALAGLAYAARPLIPRDLPYQEWEGRWACDAIISPSGARIESGHYPPVFPSPLAEEACGYTSITALSPVTAFSLWPKGKGELRLGQPLHPLRWHLTAWGAELVLDDGSGVATLRMVEDGVEMAVTGQTWHFLCKREDDLAPVVRGLNRYAGEELRTEGRKTYVIHEEVDRQGRLHTRQGYYLPLLVAWTGPSAKLLKTDGGTFMDLGARGFVKVAEPGKDPDIFEGENSDLQPPAEQEREALAASWSKSFTVEDRFLPPVTAGRQCRRCARVSQCYSVLDFGS